MRSTLIPTIKGLPNTLNSNGYATYFYSYADNQTKNIASFLHYNSIDKIMEMKTNKSILTNSIKSINQQYSQEKPFFACIYASSLYSNNSNKEIDSFIRQAKRSSWFKNTLFVFIGNQTNEKPLIFYYPKVIKPQINHTIGMQIDVVPTILSMLDKNYHNETMGMNLFAGKRSYAYYSNNQQICVLDSVFMYVYNKDKSEELYLYKSENSRTNVVKFYPDKVKEMQTYGFSMLQNSQYRLSQIQLQKH
jgi:phosphoglycerol transferase MdoB-like AlkP superfamily enzyme